MAPLTLPPGVGELFPPKELTIGDNVPPSCAIDSRGHVYYLHFARRGDVTAMRVIHYPPDSVHGTEVPIPLNPNASAIFIQYEGGLYVVGHHNEYPGGKKVTHVVSVPVADAVGPCQVF